MDSQAVNQSQSGNLNRPGTVAIVVALVLLPFILSQFGRTGEFWIWVTTEMIITGLFAMSLNLILGFGGMVSFGHAAFFGVGAYTVALLMKKAGVPLFLALLAAPVAAAIAAAIIGWFCVRLIGLYFAILTLAFSQLLYMIVFQWYTFTGGDDGIHGIPRPEFLGPTSYYLLCLAIFLVCFMLMRMIVNSSFGLSIRTIRENMERAKFIGINVRRYQWINFIIAGAFAGLAGGLLCELNRFAQTEFLHWSKSAEPILGSLVGGMYSLAGPAVGSAVLIFMKIILQQLHRSMVEMWAIVLGSILLVVVLFAPGGLASLYQKLFRKSDS
ncbi:MAG: branched-chain amino acid ABC transporter permease [Desulfomonile tiedjei]|nr:branched-chain amino acid ABC transporter permease [Desulfomonile tiedjei]